ncbi:FAD-binding oxidoreductase [Hyphomicrobium sp. CS1BSMeth3]|uniref:NAD(P)/FAD-dependent oxidoreductase n=1 Tax=Hyphomicrobium sp. CS1BSMeth3 TaxID=1892844 RepID=UPI0024532AD1|nr:FAD-binding oxidoreductase [Hyphomicrobium sp. CS1BSMeth3]
MELGAKIHQQCAARGIETSGGRVSGVVTEKGTIRTDAVLCAGGAWTSMFCRPHGIDLPQAGVFATAWRTEPVQGITDGCIGTPSFAFRRREDGGFTVGLSGRGRVELNLNSMRHALKFFRLFLIRRKALTLRLGRSYAYSPDANLTWRPDEISPFERTRVFDPQPDPKLVEEGMLQLRRQFPELRHVKAAEIWGGFIDSSPDTLPVISPVEKLPGFFIAACFSGHGFGTGPAAGHLAADLVTGTSTIVDPHPFRYSRMTDGTKLDPNSWG